VGLYTSAERSTDVLAEIIGWEFFLVLAIGALLFGGSQIPKLARSLGQASHEFKKGIAEGSADDADAAAADSAAAKPPTPDAE
jgi:sec-independent protein translocase protein TatA